MGGSFGPNSHPGDYEDEGHLAQGDADSLQMCCEASTMLRTGMHSLERPELLTRRNLDTDK